MTLAQDITRHFNGEWQGSQGAFPTPGHSKSDRGMTVKDADGGDVVFYSHNGGDWRAVKDECRRIGLLPDRPRANDNGEGWRETGSYEYVGADGTVVYRTVRKEKAGQRKRFLAQRPDGRGGWTNGLADVERVPYRLPAILAADPDTIVYLTEGERKADKLASWGLVATAVAFGAKGWRDAYGAALADRTVAILPDNDDEGRGFAERAAKSITEAGGRAVFVALPGLSPKGDVMDWTGTADELRALVDAALHAPAETFELADLSQWAATAPTPKAFVMAPFIPRDDVVIVTGDGGTNKSTAALQISACAAAGRQMLGMDVAPGPALYVTAEDDQRENHWRLSKIAAQIGTTLHDLAGRLHIVSLRGRLNNELATFDADGKLRPAPAYALLRATIVATNAKLVTLDNVAHLFAGNENDRSQVTAFINLLYQLCGEFGVTILLIAHRNKAGDSYSGSTAWLNAVRSQILLERSDDTDADVRRMSLGKANYARAGEELTFRWHDFALVRDADLPADRARELAAAAAASGDNMAFLACLREREKQGDGRQVGPSPGPNYAPSQFEGMAQAKGMTKERLKA
ncbi:AAA family ATPase, partial [Sphingomonas sp. ID0503]|uniref:AAA family ATPase n=1 Tax=Sphingomonas sp. ID0503 TaxID=3399691 RepID=UPI003AFAD950